MPTMRTESAASDAAVPPLQSAECSYPEGGVAVEEGTAPLDESEENLESAEELQQEHPQTTHHSAKVGQENRKWTLLVVSLVCLILAAMAVGVTVGLVNKDDSNQNGSPPASDGTPPPDVVRQLRSIFQQQQWSLPSTWLDPTSPQSRALDQLVQDFYLHYSTTKRTSDDDDESSTAVQVLTEALHSSTFHSRWKQRYALWVVALGCNIKEDIPLDECTYERIVCNQDGLVQQVFLDRMNLQCVLPEEVGLWTELVTFQAGRNLLQGALPLSLYELSGLQRLDLQHNEQLTLQLPSQLGQLSNLEYLNFNGNFVSGTLPASLMNLSNMRELWMEELGARISGRMFDFLLEWPNIEKVAVGGGILSCNLTGTIPTQISSLEKLAILELSNCLISGTVPTEIALLDNLERFVIVNQYGSRLLQGTIPSELGTNCDKLQMLGLANGNMSGTVPAFLGNCTNLKELAVWGNRLASPLPESLLLLQELHTLYLQHNEFAGFIPTWLGDLKSLETLYLHENPWEDEVIPTELCSIDYLRFDCDVICECCRSSCAD